MSRVPHARALTRARPLLLVAVAALALASCGTATPSSIGVTLAGTPTTEFSVPLSNVGCTTTDLCAALGTTTANSGPSAYGEFATAGGHWFTLTLPAVTQPSIVTDACTTTTCLFGGSLAEHDLLWRFNSVGHSVSPVTAPAGGLAVDALSCVKSACALIDNASTDATPRLSLSSDGGTTWSTPVDLSWASGDVITALECSTSLDCLVGALGTGNSFSLETTDDAGTTWRALAPPASWTSLASLTCVKRDCAALAQTSSTTLLVRSRDFGSRWSSTALHAHAASLACSTLADCVVVGQRSSGAAWLAFVKGDVATSAHLRYVPTPLLASACGAKACAAIAVTTLVRVQLPA